MQHAEETSFQNMYEICNYSMYKYCMLRMFLSGASHLRIVDMFFYLVNKYDLWKLNLKS